MRTLNCPLFCSGIVWACLSTMTTFPKQKSLLPLPSPAPGMVFVNDRVCFRTEGTQRVISVHGMVFAHYDVSDRTAEAYAMAMLFESGYADQNDIARCFGCSTRSLRRYQEHFEANGLSASLRPRGRLAGDRSVPPKSRERNQTILRLKAKGFSNRAIAGRLGLDEKAVRKRLRRLGWIPCAEPSLPFPEEAANQAEPGSDVSSHLVGIPQNDDAPPETEITAEAEAELVPRSLDRDPLDRSMDRLLAAMGLLEDAAPVFYRAANVPRAGVLLAIPALVSSGLLSVARKIYGTLGPAFYGLRTILVAHVLLALLRIPRPENLKEYAPGDLGHILGLDRMPEVKTWRRKLARLAALKGSQELGQQMAQRRIAERGRVLGFLYVDGHVRAYHGKHRIPKAYLARTRLAVPATTDYL